MPNIEYFMTADVSSVLRGETDLQRANSKSQQSFSELARSAESANAQIVASTNRSIETYDLAEKKLDSYVAVSARYRESSGRRAYSVAPPVSRGPATAPYMDVARSGDVETYELSDEHAKAIRVAASNRALHSRPDPHQLGLDVASIAASVRAEAARQREANAVKQASQEETFHDIHEEGELAKFRQKVEKSRQHAEAQSTYVSSIPGKLLASAATATAAIYAGEAFAESYAEGLKSVGDAMTGFEDTSAPLLSLGDNLKNLHKVKDNILTYSSGLGYDRQKIADAMFMLQSNTGNFAPDERTAIFQSSIGLSKVAGGDLPTNTIALAKLMETYGGEVGTAQRGAGKLMMTEDKAAITMPELASLLPDVLPAAKMMHYSYDEVAASVITATQVMGSNEKTLTGLRNMFLLMNKAVEAGLVHQGKLVDQLKELEKVDPHALEKIFGERTVSVVAALADKTADVAKNLSDIAAMPDNFVSQKFAMKLTDPAFATSQMLKIAAQLQSNADVTKSQSPTFRNNMSNYSFTSAGVNMTSDPGTPEWVKSAQTQSEYWFGGIIDAMPWSGGHDASPKTQAVLAAIKSARDAGNKDEAIYTALSKGEETGLTVLHADPRLQRSQSLIGAVFPSFDDWAQPTLVRGRAGAYRSEASNESDAELYAQMAAKGYKFDGSEQFNTWENLSATRGLGYQTKQLKPLAVTDEAKADLVKRLRANNGDGEATAYAEDIFGGKVLDNVKSTLLNPLKVGGSLTAFGGGMDAMWGEGAEMGLPSLMPKWPTAGAAAAVGPPAQQTPMDTLLSAATALQGVAAQFGPAIAQFVMAMGKPPFVSAPTPPPAKPRVPNGK